MVSIQHEVTNIYIGQPQWQPWENTLAYRPFESDMNDYSGNNHHWSKATGSVSYADNMITLSNSTLRISSQFFTWTWDFTILWFRKNCTSCGLCYWSDTSWYPRWSLWYGGWSAWNSNTWYNTSPDWDTTADVIRMWTLIKRSNNIYYYQDGVLVGSNTSMPSINVTWGNGMQLGGTGANTNGNWTVWWVIFEKVAWTEQQLLNHYKITKGKYWL